MVIVFLSKSEMRFLVLLLGLACLAALVTLQWQNFQTQGNLNRLTVVIDPGHGGVDGGAHDQHGNLEKDINLRIGLQIAKQLRESGLRVVMTRQTDIDLAPFRSGQRGRHLRDLLRRVEIALKAKSLFFVSIHCDYSRDTRKRGASVFFNWRSPASKGLAEAIQTEINQLQTGAQKIAPGKYRVIREGGVTGVLVEAGYLSNPKEALLLQNRSYQARLGLAIARGILKYTQKYLPQIKHPAKTDC
ncbi:MAG TPA: N-acetylmuramoyl-L-alanine amidase [Bacillota bacterium]